MILNADEFDNFDDANVPVDIWLDRLTEEETNDLFTGGEFASEDLEKMGNSPFWYLKASNYMPRCADVDREGITAYSDNKEELQKLLQEKVLPIYQRAMDRLKAISEGKASHLYYWNEPAEQTDD